MKTLGGIRSYMTNVSEYDRWVLSRPFQAKFVEGLLDMANLNGNPAVKKKIKTK